MQNIEISLQSETLTDDEIATITGAVRAALQIEWLRANKWIYTTTRAGNPVVGRFYARMRLAGIEPDTRSAAVWTPRLNSVR